MSTHLKQRLLVGSIGLILLSFCIYFSYTPIFQPIFVFINAAFISGAVWEYYCLARYKGFYPLTALGLICTISYVIAISISNQHSNWHHLPAFVLFLGLVIFFLAFFNKRSNPLINLAITLFGIAYLTIPLSFGLQINYFHFENSYEDGRMWLTYVFAVTKMTDIGAYFFGKLFGAHKLIPHISPKKTIEGAIGGLFSSLIISLLFYFFVDSTNVFSPLKITLWQSIWLGLTISVLAQFGDLAESLLKRDAGVKDSSYLPGLGGLLDILDSLVFTLPFMYFILKMKVLS